MTIEEFITAAIEGGWDNKIFWFTQEKEPMMIAPFGVGDLSRMLLDPEAWKAVGKCFEDRMERSISKQHTFVTYDRWDWEEKMMGLVPNLIAGQTLESYIESL